MDTPELKADVFVSFICLFKILVMDKYTHTHSIRSNTKRVYWSLRKDIPLMAPRCRVSKYRLPPNPRRAPLPDQDNDLLRATNEVKTSGVILRNLTRIDPGSRMRSGGCFFFAEMTLFSDFAFSFLNVINIKNPLCTRCCDQNKQVMLCDSVTEVQTSLKNSFHFSYYKSSMF